MDEDGSTSSFSYMDDSDELKRLRKEAVPLVSEYNKLNRELDLVNAHMTENAKQLGKVSGGSSGAATEINIAKTDIKDSGKSSAKAQKEPKFYKDPKTEAQLSKNISYYSGKLTGNDTAEERQIVANIRKWQDMKDAIELAKKAAAVPTEMKTLDDIAAKIDYLTAKRKKASQEDIAAIDAEMSELETLQRNFANKDVIAMPDDAKEC